MTLHEKIILKGRKEVKNTIRIYRARNLYACDSSSWRIGRTAEYFYYAYFREMRHYINQNQQFVTRTEMDTILKTEIGENWDN